MNAHQEKKNVHIIATGGTIAGLGAVGKDSAYKPGAISIDKIIEEVPSLLDAANITFEQFCNINSDDMTSKIWCDLARRIDELAIDDNIDGFVITHGTDTMEETAYFLNLVLLTDKPVVITGSMRPQSSISPDGPLNLYESVLVAASDDAYGCGVLGVFSDVVFHARDFTKTSTYSVTAMSSQSTNAVGYVRDDIVVMYDTAKFECPKGFFNIGDTKQLPKVGIVVFHVDADADTLRYALENNEGVVISGAGAGEYSQKFAKAIKESNKPVVVSSHSGSGMILQSSLILPDRTVASDFLTPQKAAILLRLILHKEPNVSHEKLVEYFNKF